MINPDKKINNEKNKKINYQISKNEYLFIDNFLQAKYLGKGVTYQKFMNQKLIHTIIANNILWNNKKKKYLIINYKERYLLNNKEVVNIGIISNYNLCINKKELLHANLIPENLNNYELKTFIKNEKKRGIKNVNLYLTELYQRYSLPCSAFILTILAFLFSSLKNNSNDLGKNIVLGLILAFFYIFFIELFKSISINEFSSFIIFIPNIIFGMIALFFLLVK